MEIESIRHKALRRFFLTGQSRGLDGNLVERLRKMLSYINSVSSFDELVIPPNYGLHPLTGNRAGSWSMTVTKNWRMTFAKIDDETIADLDLEDYH
ncbi:type II toxin-antitoxin system RelE/ParE family toxin [Parasphingorhabdus sp.]|uniref:type II toxin-antitoxin system RelE/ParE family toxin n=1 Tax=Parasphingorhabdus sp. TaxID=2709688 RepID=UPI0039E26453